MNTSNGTWCRLTAALAAAGILTAFVAGCGGGGGGNNDGNGDTGPTLAITAENGEAVSTTVVTGVLAMFDITEGAGGPIIGPTASSIPLLRKIGRAPGTFYQVPIQGTEFCDVSGTIELSGNLADPNTLSEGDTINAVFDDCDDGDGFVINGGLGLTVVAIEGDVLIDDVFSLTLDMVLTDLTVLSDGEVTSGDGDLTYTFDALDFPAIDIALSGGQLGVTEGGQTITFRNFDQTLAVVPGVATTYTAAANGMLDSSVLGGSVDYETIVPIEAIGDDMPPATGEVLVTGADNSLVRIVVVSEELVRLEIDVQGDGVVDEFIDTTWAALSGESSG